MATQVNDIITNANGRSDSAVEAAQRFIDELSDLATDNVIDFAGSWRLTLGEYLNEVIGGVSSVTPGTPTLRTLGLNSVDAPGTAPVDPAIALWTDRPIDDFTGVAPTLDLPTRPTTAVPTAPPAPSEVRDITLPTFQEYDLPTAPVLEDESIPTLDALAIEGFDTSTPELTLLAPANSFTYAENTYSSDLKSAVETLLEGDIQNGGYGIETADEQALFDRTRDRVVKESVAAVAQIRRGVASRNFPMPPGSLYAAERAALQEADAALSDANREITLERARLYVQARQFAVQQGISLEQALLTYTGAKQERALNTARAAADFALQFHTAEVNIFNIRLELRRLARDLHAQQLETVRVSLESFRAELERTQTADRRNEVRMTLYQGLLKATEVAYNIQIAQAQRSAIEADIEKLKLQMSEERTRVYVAQVQARRDEFDAYATAIQGERVRLELYEQELGTHERKVDVAVKDSARQEALFNAQLRQKQTVLQHWTAKVDKYKADVQKVGLQLDADTQFNKDAITAWNIQLEAAFRNVENNLNERIEQVKQLIDSKRSHTDYMGMATNAINQHKELRGAAAKSALALYEQAIAGAENSLNAIATLTE